MPKPRGMVRGYTGYYNGKYLRSSLEFAYAYYLDHFQIEWGYEEETFELSDFYYKPDFFIKEKGGVIKIVEIKGEGNFKLGTKKLQEFQEKYSIPIEMYTYKDLVKLYQDKMPIRLNAAKRKWIEEYGAELSQCYIHGKYNPMFGVTQKDETKLLISEKAKERFKDPNYKKKITENLIEFNRMNGFAASRGQRSERVIKICANPSCDNKFTITIFSKRKYCGKKCAGACTSVYGSEISKAKAKELRDEIKVFILDWAIKNINLVLETKFNGITNLNPLYKLIEEQFGIKDKRIITKSLLGEDKGRKEFLKYLKEWVLKYMPN